MGSLPARKSIRRESGVNQRKVRFKSRTLRKKNEQIILNYNNNNNYLLRRY